MADSRVDLYKKCILCPRKCGIDRTLGITGFCGLSHQVRIAWAGLHRGEEPPLTGETGSGTIFFSGCTLRCNFCQNHQISQSGMGRTISQEELVDIILALQKAGAVNINLVTGTPFLPSIRWALKEARSRGMTLPVVWNSSGYELPEIVDGLSEFVDIFLPDIKTLDPQIANRYFHASNYPQMARDSVVRMTNRSVLGWSGDMMIRGVIVRHLVMPGHLEASRDVLQFFSKHLRYKALLSLMVQYIPGGGKDRPEDSVTEEDYLRLLNWLDQLGIEDGFIQERTDVSPWLPDFSRSNPFPPGFGIPVWHWANDPGC